MQRQAATPVIMLYLLATVFPSSEAAINNTLLPPNNAQCACSGDVLTYRCTIEGGGNTIWRGSAFSCPTINNQIILRHSQFSMSTGTSQSCNSGAIVGRSLSVENNSITCFISELDITVSESLNSRVVQCDHNFNTRTTNIGSSTLNVVSASNLYPPPSEVMLSEIDQGQVTFNWTSVSSSCPSIDYVITSDCGVCPSSTNTTTVTCSDLQLPTRSDDSVCSFNVSSRVCGIVGNQTTSVLAVPDVPRVRIIPVYYNESQYLKKIIVNIAMYNTTANNDISGSITEYITTYSTPSEPLRTNMIPASTCESDVCTFTTGVPSSVCSSSSKTDVTVSAANRIGQGPLSNTFIFGCTNTFVHVNFNPTTSIFSCEFLNELNSFVKSCEILYYAIDFINHGLTVQGQTTTENPNFVSIDLGYLDSGTYYYVVTASSNVTTVKIEGYYVTKDGQKRDNTLALVTGSVISVAVTLCVILVVALFILYYYWTRNRILRSYQLQSSPEVPLKLVNDTNNDSELFKQLKLKEITDRKFTTFEVTQDCTLQECFEKQTPRSNVFYELLTNEKEDITDDKELILQKKNVKTITDSKMDTPNRKETLIKELDTGKLFIPGIDSNTLYNLWFKGEGIMRSKFGDKYRVFVLSKELDARHLAKGLYILYEKKFESDGANDHQVLSQLEAVTPAREETANHEPPTIIGSGVLKVCSI